MSVKRCCDLRERAVGGTVGNHQVECSRHFVFPLVSLKQQTLDLCGEELLSVTCEMLFLDLSRQDGSLSSNECAWGVALSQPTLSCFKCLGSRPHGAGLEPALLPSTARAADGGRRLATLLSWRFEEMLLSASFCQGFLKRDVVSSMKLHFLELIF